MSWEQILRKQKNWEVTLHHVKQTNTKHDNKNANNVRLLHDKMITNQLKNYQTRTCKSQEFKTLGAHNAQLYICHKQLLENAEVANVLIQLR